MRNPASSAADPVLGALRRPRVSLHDGCAIGRRLDRAGLRSRRRAPSVAVDGRLSRVLALTDYPRHVSPNWLGRADRLRRAARPEPAPRPARLRGRRAQPDPPLVELQSSRMLDARGGRIASAEREVAYEDVERLRDALERGDERVFSASLYLRLHGRNALRARPVHGAVEGALGGMMAGARAALYEMLPGLLSCLPAGQDYLGRRRNLDTSSVATMIPFTSSHLAVERGLLYGENVHNHSLVIFDPFGAEQENANKVVFAKSGAGKSLRLQGRGAARAAARHRVLRHRPGGRVRADLRGGRRADDPALRHVGAPHQPLRPAAAARRRGARSAHGARARAAGPARADARRPRRSPRPARARRARRGALRDLPPRRDHPRPRDARPSAAGAARPARACCARRDDAARPRRPAANATSTAASATSSPQRTSAALDRPFVVFNVRDLEEELRPLAIYLIADHVWREVHAPPAAAHAADRRGVVADALPGGRAVPRADGAAGAQALARPHDGDAGRRGLPGLRRRATPCSPTARCSS